MSSRSSVPTPSTPLPGVPLQQHTAMLSPLTPGDYEGETGVLYNSKEAILLTHKDWSIMSGLSLVDVFSRPSEESFVYAFVLQLFGPWTNTVRNGYAYVAPQLRILPPTLAQDDVVQASPETRSSLVPDFTVMGTYNFTIPLLIIEVKALALFEQEIPFGGFQNSGANILYMSAVMTATRDAIGQVCAQAFCMFNARPEVPAIYVMLVAHIKWTLVLFHRPPEWQQAAEKTQPSSTSSTSPRTPLARRPNYTQLEGYAEAIKKLKGELASTLATTLKLKSELLYFCEDCIRWPHVDASQGRVMFPPIYPTERFAKALRLVIEANRAADIIFDYQPSWYDVVDEQATKPDSQLLDEGEEIFEHAYGKMVCKIMEPLDELIRPDELEDAMEEMEAESKDGNYKPSQVKRAATRLRARFLTRLQTTTPVKKKVRDQLPKLAPIRRPTGTAKAKFVPTSPTSPTPAGPRQGLPHVVTAPTTTKPGDVQQ